MSKLPSRTKTFYSRHLADGVSIYAKRHYSPSRTSWWWTITIQGPNYYAAIDLDKEGVLAFAEAIKGVVGEEEEG